MSKKKKCLNNCEYHIKESCFCLFHQRHLEISSYFCEEWIDKHEKVKTWSNVPYKTWYYEWQTKMKHVVLDKYLKSWSIILRNFKRLNFFDWFGWIWAYHLNDIESYNEKNFWSPIFAINHIEKLIFSWKIDNWNVIIIDKENSNLDNIKSIIKYEKINRSSKLQIHYINWDFDNEINKFLDINLAPSFFFIDPFWFAWIKFSTLERIMKQKQSEIFLNFMFNAINRHISNEKNSNMSAIFDDYFWWNEWNDAKKLQGEEREKFIINLFRGKCKKISKYAYAFKLKYPEIDRTYYYLIHLTNHHLGIKIMKEIFSKNNLWDLEYSWNIKDKSQQSLFEKIDTDDRKEKFIQMLKNKYSKRDFYFSSILENFIDETDLTERWIKAILKELEEQLVILVTAEWWRNRKGGFTEKDLIKFV